MKYFAMYMQEEEQKYFPITGIEGCF